MIQSNLQIINTLPVQKGEAVARGLHVAIIPDGNGRWAAKRGLPRTAGHRAGAEAVRRAIEAARECGVRALTLFAFSADNWQRPATEVSTLMNLLHRCLLTETRQCLANGIRLGFIGRRDRLPRSLRLAMEAAETLTKSGNRMHLRIAVDYSSRETIWQAARRLRELSESDFQQLTRDDFAQMIADSRDRADVSPDVDLLIRTSGEQRLSDFLLWECAYAEMIFTRTLWPDFNAEDLRAAIDEFHSRDRRFGRVREIKAG
jgi:undecaprenyl diphosphate synthase